MKKLYHFVRRYGTILKNITLLLLSSFLLVFVVYGWYTSNKEVGMGGIVAISNNQNVIFKDVVHVKRLLNDKVISEVDYKSDNLKNFYLYDSATNSYVLENGNKIPFSLKGIFPNETIDITVGFKSDDSGFTAYSLYFANFGDDLESSEFKITVSGISYEHSVRGVFRVGQFEYVKTTDTIFDSETDYYTKKDGIFSLAAVTPGEAISEDYYTRGIYDWEWLATYNGSTVSDTLKPMVCVSDGSFESLEKKGEYYLTTFRLELNLEQYQTLENTSSNLLSEKTISIGAIRIIPR